MKQLEIAGIKCIPFNYPKQVFERWNTTREEALGTVVNGKRIYTGELFWL